MGSDEIEPPNEALTTKAAWRKFETRQRRLSMIKITNIHLRVSSDFKKSEYPLRKIQLDRSVGGSRSSFFPIGLPNLANVSPASAIFL